jgi:RHS repeat-associated protein
MKVVCLRSIVMFVCLAALGGIKSFGQQSASVSCDVTCSVDPGSSGYDSIASARPKPLNGRGYSSALAPIAQPFNMQASLISTNRNNTNVGSQSYNYRVPILTLPGRAGLNLNLSMDYSSRIWSLDPGTGTITFNADRDFPSYGFRLDFGFLEYAAAADTYVLTEADGTKRALPNSAGSYDTVDGSFIHYNPVNKLLTYKNGTTVAYGAFYSQQSSSSPTLFRPYILEDTNGNALQIFYVAQRDQAIDHIRDTLGRDIVFTYNNGKLQDIRQNVAVSSVDPTGIHIYASFHWTTIYPSTYTWYNFTGVTVNGAPSGPLNAIDECTYANGTGYHFVYSDWGIITRIEKLSSNGTVRSYISYNFPQASAGPLSDAPSFTQQTVSPDGTTTATWQYNFTKSGTGMVNRMSITDPAGNISISTLDSGGLLSSVQTKDSSNKAWMTTNYTWTISGNSVLPGTITTTNDAGQQSQQQFSYDSYGNVTDEVDYDFGLVMMRHMVTSYLADDSSGAAYVAKHILHLPKEVQIKDPSGAIKARTGFTYDSTGFYNSTDINANGHDNSSYGVGSPNTNIRGNLTAVTRYSDPVTPGGGITRTATFDTLGNLRRADVDCCNQETFNFSSQTQWAYQDSVVRGAGPQFTRSFTYNIDKGLPLTSTDENSQLTSYVYDSMNRMISVTGPANSVNGAQVTSNTAYADDVLAPTVTTSNSGGNSVVTVASFDGLGRNIQLDTRNATNLVSSVKYGYNGLGQRIQASNPFAPGENQLNSTFAYDPLGRIASITPPSGGSTQYVYSGNTVTVTDPAGKQRRNYTDAGGRLVRVDEPGWGDAFPGTGSVTISGAEGVTQVCQDTQPTVTSRPPFCQNIYDSGTVTITVNGLTKSVPYSRLSTTAGIAGALRDAFNSDGSSPVNAAVSGTMILFTAKATGAVTNYTLSGSSSTNDPADFAVSFTANPSGATLSGGEDAVSQSTATLSSSRHLTTTYGYDVLDHMISVSQGQIGPVNGQQLPGQTRVYGYDALGRLTTATTPESGTVTNYYTTASGGSCAGDTNLVCRVQDARGVVRTLSYDAVNRISAVQYSDNTPAQIYQYDTGGAMAFALGRLTTITEGTNSQTFTYDNWGQVSSVSHLIDGAPYVVQYGYNAAGQISSITYPTKRVVSQNYDGIGRLTSICDGSNCSGTTYLSNVSYNAAVQPMSFNYGNGDQGTFSYNDHLQLATLRYSHSGSTTDILNLAYDYGTNNNGQVQTIRFYTAPGSEDTSKTQYFTYDQYAHLSAAQTGTFSSSTPGTWSLTWQYDRFGNRVQQNLVGGNTAGTGIGQTQFTVDPNTNRITNPGIIHDAAGNMTADGSNNYSYDALNRMQQINGGAVRYTYFNQLRIKKVVGSTTTTYIYAGNQPIVEYVNGSLSKEYIYNGTHILAEVASGAITYHHPDHLSDRADTDASGNTVARFGNAPFGESWYGAGSAKWKFTTYERNSESGLDYAQFRNYSSSFGRFLSADFLGGQTSAPQSLNRYSYSTNDPVNSLDPLGLLTVCATPYWGTEYSDGHVEILFGATVCWNLSNFVGGGAGGGAGGGFQAALNALLAILKGTSDCAKFFNDAAKNFLPDSQTPAAAVLSSDHINPENGPSMILEHPDAAGTSVRDQPWAARTTQDAGLDATIILNQNGAFYKDRALVRDAHGSILTTGDLTIGGADKSERYQGKSLGAQVTILAHELAHTINAIPSDAGNPKQSVANTQTILDKCKSEIDKAAGK